MSLSVSATSVDIRRPVWAGPTLTYFSSFPVGCTAFTAVFHLLRSLAVCFTSLKLPSPQDVLMVLSSVARFGLRQVMAGRPVQERVCTDR